MLDLTMSIFCYRLCGNALQSLRTLSVSWRPSWQRAVGPIHECGMIQWVNSRIQEANKEIKI